MISYTWHSINPRFESASQLKAALLASFVQADIDLAGGRPVLLVEQGREFIEYPPWGWIKLVLETRSDWWPALGIAIQHATNEHGFGRIALAAALRDNMYSALAILEWLVPLAKDQSDDLAKCIGELQVMSDEAEKKGIRLGDKVEIFVASAADLEPAMRQIAPEGWSFELWGDFLSPPWASLRTHAYVHRWLAAALPEACVRIGLGDTSSVETTALLDYLLKERDLWMLLPLFDAWAAKPPKWWSDAAVVESIKGQYTPKEWQGYANLGSIAMMMGARARQQAATPAVLDLASTTPPFFRRARRRALDSRSADMGQAQPTIWPVVDAPQAT